MLTRIIAILLCTVSLSLHAQDIKDLNGFFREADLFFKQHVTNGKVDYAAIKVVPDELNALVKYMGKADLSNATNVELKAFYINAYNLTMIKALVEKYPIASPLDDADIFTGEKHLVAGEQLTLEKIEKEKLLKATGDERLHFILVCGANGCPPLADFGYMPDKLELQILGQTRLALSDKNFIRVKDKDNTVEVSEIFNWYSKDFAATGKTTLAYINQFREKPIPADYKVTFYQYDWSLNIKK